MPKKNSLIGMIICFNAQSPSEGHTWEEPPVVEEETVAADMETVSITEDSLYSPSTEEMEKDELAVISSLKKSKGKKVKKSRKESKHEKDVERTNPGDTTQATTEVSQSSKSSKDDVMGLSTMIKSSLNQLEKERSLLEQKEQKTSLLLRKERSKNVQLQSRLIELENQIADEPVRNTESDELVMKIEMLEAENELLRHKTQRLEQTIENLAANQQTDMKRRLSGNHSIASATTMMSSRWSGVTSLRPFVDNASVYSTGGRWESLEEASLDNLLSVSSIPSGAKAQGEILQLRSTLGRAGKAFKMQAEELSGLKDEVEELRKQLGLDPKGTSGTKRRVLGATSRPNLEPVYRVSQSDLSQSSDLLSQCDVNDMTRPKELSSLLDF